MKVTDNKDEKKKRKGDRHKKNKIPASKAAYSPAEKEIRRKANEIYNLRKEFDIEGTPEDDWYQAEKLLMDYGIPPVQ